MELSYNELEEVLAALKEIKGLRDTMNEIHKISSKNPNAFQH